VYGAFVVGGCALFDLLGRWWGQQFVQWGIVVWLVLYVGLLEGLDCDCDC